MKGRKLFIMEEDKNIADSIFKERRNEIHIQLEETESLINQCDEKNAIAYISKSELEELCSPLEKDELTHSNDMVFDLIIDYAKKEIEDERLLELINNLKIGNVDEKDIFIGRAYPKYYDNSYYIEISRKMDHQIRLLSDVWASYYMIDKSHLSAEKQLFTKLLQINLQRFQTASDETKEYNEIQYDMAQYEKSGNNFTDVYITYSREINEIALATLIGHEIGHHYLGHTDSDNENSENAKIKELKADEFGIEFAFRYLESAYSNDTSSYSIHQLVAIYVPLIVSVQMVGKSEFNIFKDQKEHPAIIKRIAKINLTLSKVLDNVKFINVKKNVHKLFTLLKMKDIYIISEKIANEIEQKLTTDIPQNKNF